jgi:hypothetical protein
MTQAPSADQLARLDYEIRHLELRARRPSAGLAEHIVLEAARRMRMSIARELARRSSTMESAAD